MAVIGEYVPSPDARTADQVALIESSGGAQGTTLRGMPVVVVTYRGRRSGKVRKVALMRVEHDGTYAIVASMGGAPRHPVWYGSVVDDPDVELQDGPERHPYVAREVSGEERDLWWARSVEAYPDYADYARKTDRVIPVLVLERV